MTSPQGEQAIQAEQETERLSQRAYGIALPAMRQEYGSIADMLAKGGETEAQRAGFAGARTSVMEDTLKAQAGAASRERQSGKAAALGGNVGAPGGIPSDVGATLARALYGPRITEAMGSLDETNKMFAASIGQGTQAGSGALSAFGNELTNLPMMQNYNSTYANVLGALNLGSSIYGAGKSAGWFSGGTPTATSYAGGQGSYGGPPTGFA